MKKFLMLIAMTMCLGATGYAQDLRNSSNSYIGKIESDGTVRDRSNSYLGKIENDGTVRDKSNRSIGKADGIERRYAALFFFFGMP